ncbi:hypothetical protein [Enterococcus sp. AZ109]|uniref:hypothetical protein n=1 Tax=Enterococcus sp. AZ109 TaxID=2774634 RepID=UPI003F272F84
MKSIVRKAFTLFLIIFMIGGTALVLGQLIGLIIQNGNLMVKTSELVGTPTFICAAIAGMLGFVYSYFPDKKNTE